MGRYTYEQQLRKEYLKLYKDLAQGFLQIFQTYLETDLVNNIKQQNYIICHQSLLQNWCFLKGTECLLPLMKEDFYNK